jgi:hypothetical protein
MSILRVIASKSATAALAAGCLTAMSGWAATPSVAAPASAAAPVHAAKVHWTLCKLHHNTNYPPGKCYLRFNRGRYHHGQKLNFHSGVDFKPGEALKVIERCKGGYVLQKHHTPPHYHRQHTTAGGRAVGRFIIGNHTPLGTCSLTVTGLTSGSKVRGTFKVVRKPKKH